MRHGIVGALLLILLALPSLAVETTPDRARQLQDKLLAPCCYSESLAVHRSELAAKLRSDIRNAVAAGKSDREIIDGYVAQYGLRILREPEGERSTWLHVIPIVAVLLGMLCVLLVLKRLRGSPKPKAAVPAGPQVDVDEDLW
jgi:cytochrome c-type biogenesis protein CcmH